MGALADDPSPDSPPRRLLAAQERLIEVQIGLGENERFRNRIKAVRDIALTTGVVMLVGLAGLFVWRASQADEMMLEPWTAPPTFAEAGRGGEVLAAQLGDRIKAMQIKAETEATGVAKETGGQSTDLELQIPNTGVSIDDLERWLRRRLGRQTIVSGAVTQEGDRLSVTVRTGAGEASTFEGGPAELPALLDKAAEATLRQSDPLRYAGYLIVVGRYDEAAKVVVPLTYRGSDRERAYALTNLVNIRTFQDRSVEALATARAAAKLDARSVAALGYLASAEMDAGHDEAAISAVRASIVAQRDRAALLALPPFLRALLDEMWPAALASLTGDFAEATQRFRRIVDVQRAWGREAGADHWRVMATANAIMGHDRATAAALWRDLPAKSNVNAWDMRLMLQKLTAAREGSDRAEALMLARVLAARQNSGSGLHPQFWVIVAAPEVAAAFAEAGDITSARAVIAPMPLDCDLCTRARGRIATADRQWAEADRWFAKATATTPSIPDSWSGWGESRLAQGDLDGAIAMFRKAQKLGPRWADPLKLEGDALMRQGKTGAAVRRYREAAERAPRWVALHLDWADALDRIGKPEEAKAKRRGVLGMLPSPAERARIGRQS